MEEIRYASVLYYRVIVTHNPKKPDVLYIDICRDGFYSHDWALKKLRKIYQDDELERVFNDSNGIKIKEIRHSGEISLLYTKHHDVMAQLYQQKLRARIDPEIMRVFKQMKAENKLSTTDMSILVSVIAEDMKSTLSQDNFVIKSLREEELKAECDRLERLKKLKRARLAYYAGRKYASAPYLRLKMQQLAYSGD